LDHASRICAILLAVALLASFVLAQDRIAELRAKFDQESNPVRKAKLLPDLGDAEFDKIGADAANGDIAGALSLASRYRDQAQSCVKNLDATDVSADKHPNGCKQLQISVQESLRKLDAALRGMTADDQMQFANVRQDLAEMNEHLIEELFPDRSSAKQQKKTS
jgi:hypothetical protein